MRLARLGDAGAEIPVVAGAADRWFDARPIVPDIDAQVIAHRLPELRAALQGGSLPEVETAGRRFGPPLTGIGKLVGVGHNYLEHVRETGRPVPPEPVMFLKTADVVVGPDDTVYIPRGSTHTDWEVELAVVIGAQARYLSSPEESLSRVAGYCVSNDVSEREFQLERGGTWDKGKNCETFNPLGPWIVTADEIPDPQTLELTLSVNGRLRQSGNTSDMIFPVAYLIWYLSQFLVLRPGDVINTGTPAGVASGQPDKPFLRDGHVVRAGITGLGWQEQTFRDAII